MPLGYAGGGVLREHAAVRERVGLFDVSHLGKIAIVGPGAADFVNRCLSNDLNKIGPSQAQYTLCVDDATGGVVDDIIAYLYGDDHVFLIPNAANTTEVVRRLSGRRTCRRCGRVWHATFDPPSRPGICDDCGGELFQRDDDREETIRHRLEVYQQQTSPLIAFYADEGILLGIDATGPVDEITDRALNALRRFMR